MDKRSPSETRAVRPFGEVGEESRLSSARERTELGRRACKRNRAASVPSNNDFFALLERRRSMNVERYLRLIAGCFVLASLLLGYFHSPYWFLLTGFVALNLIQSAFTNWCPMMTFLRQLGARSEGESIANRART